MHPIEQLRYVARAGDADPTQLARYAAEALGQLAYEPRALVTSCRRLIESHPSCGPLWWVAAHVLSADDPVEGAKTADLQLAIDNTAQQLARILPENADVVCADSEAIVGALSDRPDVFARVYGMSRARRMWLKRTEQHVQSFDAHTPALREELDAASLVVIEPRAVGASGYLLTEEDALVVDAASALAKPIWMVAGTGRILPPSLFDACVERSMAERSSAATQQVQSLDDDYRRDPLRVTLRALDVAECIVGPDGSVAPTPSNLHPRCPAPRELFRTAS